MVACRVDGTQTEAIALRWTAGLACVQISLVHAV